MPEYLERLDKLASISDSETGAARLLDRIAFVFLTLMVLFVPHSIAATQIAWLTGMAAWLVRMAIGPRPRIAWRMLDIALWGFVVWSLVSSFVSYEPAISLDRMRGVSVFLIFYFAAGNIRSLSSAYFLAFALIVSCMVNVVWMPLERIFGRGVEIVRLEPGGFADRSGLRTGDTILSINKTKVRSPEAVVDALNGAGSAELKFYRQDYDVTIRVEAAALSTAATATEQLGIAKWKPSRNWRSAGFFGHYTTYAEILQLIGSLALGLLVAIFFSGRRNTGDRIGGKRLFAALSFAVAMIGVVLLMTVTRGSQLAFAVSGFFIFMFGAARKWFIAALAVAIPLAAAGVLVVQHTREKGFFDATDDSTLYRFTMWKDGVRIWSGSPRNVVFGVGMDSVQKHWREWDMFDGGRMPLGHFHSTPMQLLVERGFPALLFWLAIVYLYGAALLRAIRRRATADVRSVGILLGCFGGLAGFLVSGIAHYNLGDQEVAMAFYLLMAIGLRVAVLEQGRGNDPGPELVSINT